MLRDMYIIGTIATAREIADLVYELNLIEQRWNIQGFVGPIEADTYKLKRISNNIYTDEWILENVFDADIVMSVVNPRLKEKILSKYIGKNNFNFPNLIHPTAYIYPTVKMGIGNVIHACSIISSDGVIGNFNSFHLHCSIGHDSIIGDYNSFNPTINTSGHVTIGNNVLMGVGSLILENKTIGSGSTIGAGAVVLNDVPENVTMVGIPAKIIRRND